MSSDIAVVVFVVSIIAAIMFHEWGHFWTARRFGMRADRFFLGFGPTLWSTQRGETEYGVKLLPLGGFVRIRGMAPSDTRRRPVPDELLDPEKVAEDRRAAAKEAGVDVLEVPALPDRTFDRLRDMLLERGAGKDLAERITRRVRRNLGDDAVPMEARGVLTEVLVTEITDTERHGDLHHRVLEGDKGRFFHDRPAWQRAIVLAAGSVSHFVVAIVLLFVGFLLFPQPTPTPVIEGIEPGSAAAEAGLEPGDRLVAVAETRSQEFEPLRQEIQQHPGDPIELVVERDGARLRVTATPTPTEQEDGETIGILGFMPEIEEQRLSFGDAVYETFAGRASVTAITTGTIDAMGRVFGPEGIASIFEQVAGQEPRPVESPGTLVGIANTAGQGTAMFGAFFLLLTVASVNVFIGIFNALPLPPLDGGHLAILGVERSVNAVRSRMGKTADFTVDPRTIAAIAMPVIVFLGIISVALLWLDITNPIDLQ